MDFHPNTLAEFRAVRADDIQRLADPFENDSANATGRHRAGRRDVIAGSHHLQAGTLDEDELICRTAGCVLEG